MELCLFQGTFNPIHNAHIRVAEYAVKNCGVAEVIFIPAFAPPHKEYDKSMSQHRYNMVELAIKDIPGLKISDIEFQLGGKSYTYRTICELCKRYAPKNKINFIIGTDAFRHIESWYEAEKLKDKLKFLLFVRDKNFDKKEFEHLKNKGYEFELMPLEFEDISSTELREAIKSNSDLSGLIPKKVEEYIKKNDLYKN